MRASGGPSPSDEIGDLQFRFMVREAGLRPEMRLLELGCGRLRGAVRFVDYLDRGNYYGVDNNAAVIEAGLEVELPRHGLEGEVDPAHLLVAEDFGSRRFETDFDRAIVPSLWTEVPLGQVERSLRETARVLKPDGAIYANFFLCDPPEKLPRRLVHHPGGVATRRDRAPYHFTWEQMSGVCGALGLRAELLGEWGHPRAQQMARITRPQGGSERPPGRSAQPGVHGQVVVVLGMHRSGTSALAGSLQYAGLDGGEVVEEGEHNRRGNRENLEIQGLNDDVLAASGGGWKSPPSSLLWTTEQANRRNEIVARFGPDAPWIFKDPRTLITYEFWQGAAVEMLPVGVFRHPVRVVNSLDARSSMSTVDGLRLWCQYNRILLRLHRSDPFPLLCFDVEGETFQRQLHEAIELLSRDLRGGVELSHEAASRFYAPELVHGAPGDRELSDFPRARRERIERLLARAEALYDELKTRSLVGSE